MEDLMALVKDHFARDEWPVQEHESGQMLRFRYEADSGPWTGYVWVRQPQAQVIVYSLYPQPVPEARRAAVAEFLTRANCGQILCAFELDWASGEVRCRSALDLREAVDCRGLFGPVLKANLVVFGDHLAGLDAVVAGRQSPQEAIATIDAARPDLDLRH